MGWAASELAKQAGLSLRTIHSVEAENGHAQVRKSSILAVQAALEAAGIEFIGTPDDGPGIRIRTRPGT